MNILKRVLKREVITSMTHLIYGATDIGRKRSDNEDSYLMMPEMNMYMVADGMGGHNAGEVASLKAVQVVGKQFNSDFVMEMRNNGHNIDEKLKAAVIEAHRRIMEMSEGKEEYAGMGSTIAISFIHNKVLHTCHVGDSRIYVVNSSGITQVTNDHSTVAEMVRHGKMSREEARLSPMKNRITQALGVDRSVDPEYNKTCALKRGDVVLLCSDGLWDMLPDKEIQSVIMRDSDMRRACLELIQKANNAGGEDNITVILVKNR